MRQMSARDDKLLSRLAMLMVKHPLASVLRTRGCGEFASVRPLTVVIVGNTPYIVSAVIDSLPADFPYFLVGHRNIAFLRRSKRCLQYFVNDLALEEDNKADFIQTIERLGSGTNSSMLLIPVDDSANRILHSTRGRLDVSYYPMPDSNSFEMLNDKWRFHQYCSKLGARVPTAIRLNNKAEIGFDDVCARVGLPFVLKPTNKSNCVGFRIIHSKKQFNETILSNRTYNFSPLIAQTFIPGIDIDISILANGGHVQNFAVQIIKENMICFVQNEKLVKFAEAIVRDLCYTGVIHIDARLHDVSEEVFLIEANPRFWASLAEATVSGLNFVRAGICTVLDSQRSDPTTIYDVRAPSVRQMLAEIATGRRNYLQLSPQQRYRVNCGARTLIKALLHLPLAYLIPPLV